MKHLSISSVFFLLTFFVSAQKKTTTSASIKFDATTKIDNLPKAENIAVIAALNTKKGTVQFEAPIKSFAFGNPKIMEHFNTKAWMNSDEFPITSFNGLLANVTKIDFKNNGTYETTVSGDLTIRGVTNKITAPVTFIVDAGIIYSTCEFTIKLADYGVDGPAVGAGKVSREPKIFVRAEFKK